MKLKKSSDCVLPSYSLHTSLHLHVLTEASLGDYAILFCPVLFGLCPVQCRALYYVGLYDQCISRCGAAHVTGLLGQQEKEGLLYACRLMQSRQAQGGVSPDELVVMSSSPNPFLKSLAVYVQFLSAVRLARSAKALETK